MLCDVLRGNTSKRIDLGLCSVPRKVTAHSLVMISSDLEILQVTVSWYLGWVTLWHASSRWSTSPMPRGSFGLNPQSAHDSFGPTTLGSCYFDETLSMPEEKRQYRCHSFRTGRISWTNGLRYKASSDLRGFRYCQMQTTAKSLRSTLNVGAIRISVDPKERAQSPWFNNLWGHPMYFRFGFVAQPSVPSDRSFYIPVRYSPLVEPWDR